MEWAKEEWKGKKKKEVRRIKVRGGINEEEEESRRKN